MNLTHYRATPITRDVIEVVFEQKQENNHKPRGFWVSVDGEDDWKSWCESEGFQLASLKVPHRVILMSEANVLRIDTPEALDAFSKEYGRGIPGLTMTYVHHVAWGEVAKRYDGIIIAPYQWTRRMRDENFWYCSWDCASGCIWRKRAVARLEIVGVLEIVVSESSRDSGLDVYTR